MNGFPDDKLYTSFRQAADAWLERWSMLQGGCMHLSQGLSEFPVETREEWETMALSFITTYHCGRGTFDFINRIHKLIVQRILEDIQSVGEGDELRWQIKPAQR
ncbi:MAG: hypothetical protein JJW03_05390, partial [Desulfosarcina sp.]|nr:hypothetical protein [Desulfobacterales bacterium]